MTNLNIEYDRSYYAEFFSCTEEYLREQRLLAGEAYMESETLDGSTHYMRLCDVINAIGKFRFGHSWGDGLPAENEPESDNELVRDGGQFGLGA